MRYYNAMQAAKILNISDKTVRRYVAKGKLTAKRTEFNELAISEDEVARLWAELNEARAQFRQNEQDNLSPQSGMSAQSSLSSQSTPIIPLTDTTLTETVKQLGKLAARVDVQQARIEELEHRVAELESKQAAEKPEKLYRFQVDAQEAKTQQGPQKRNVARNKALPDGCILCSDFAKRHGIPVRSMHDYLVLGIGKGTVPGELGDPMIPVKEQIDYSERPKPGRSREIERYFNEEQAEKAIEVLKRHGKIKEASE